MDKQERIVDLIVKHIMDTSSEEEKRALEVWLAEAPANRAFLDKFTYPFLKEHLTGVDPTQTERRLKRILQLADQDEKKKKVRKIRTWVSAAAVFLAIALTFVFFLFNKKQKPELATHNDGSNQVNKDQIPGGKMAILTLGNGTTLPLDSTAEGLIAQEGGSNINKLVGQITYHSTGEKNKKNKEITFNTLSTPRGGKYRMVLPDGTKVWLNVASSIGFPTAFKGKERKVSVKGEVYFEVAKNDTMPFLVQANNTKVEVLGTHFIVKAYAEENNVSTTLIEGSVKVKEGEDSVTLKPGQQAQLNNRNKLDVLNNVDTDKVLGWKNEIFVFDGESIKSIMRIVSRYYDVEIDTTAKISDDPIIGTCPQNVSLVALLSILEEIGDAKLEVVGRKVFVKPKE